MFWSISHCVLCSDIGDLNSKAKQKKMVLKSITSIVLSATLNPFFGGDIQMYHVCIIMCMIKAVQPMEI